MNNEKKGLVHIYTGDGKGKTTAAIGLAVRARGQNLNVCWISFHKNYKPFHDGEFKILEEIGVKRFSYAKYSPIHNPFKTKEELMKNARKECLNALKFIKEEIYGNFDVLILDEILISLREGYLNVDEILSLIKEKPENLELILTGRCSDEKLEKIIPFVDYMSKIEKIKHPYDLGVKRRRGIDY